MSSLTTLPHEILESIFNEIDVGSPEGRQTVSACSLTNKALLPFCQALLFQDIKITYTRRFKDPYIVFGQLENTTGRKFLNLLHSSPHLSRCVKTLTITLLNNLYSFGKPLSGEITSAAASFSLYEIVPKLTNLQGFSASFPDCVVWDGLEERTRRFFCTTIPSLVTQLDVSIFDPFPVSELYGCHQLEELRICSFRVDNEEAESEIMADGSRVKLQALELKGIREYNLDESMIRALHGARSPFDFSRLQRFVSSSQSRPLTDIACILSLFFDRLQEIDFWMCIHDKDGTTFAKQIPDFGRFSNLSQLTIRTLIYRRYYGRQLDDVTQEDNDFAYIARILQTFPVDTIQPQQIRVSLIFVLAYLPNIENSLPLLPWGDLLGVLEDGRLTSRFKSVELGIGRVERDVLLFDMPLRVVSDMLDKNAGLKRLRERGILSYAYHKVPNMQT